MGCGAIPGRAERRCIRWHAIFSVLVERRRCRAAGGGGVCLACGGCRARPLLLLLARSRFRAIGHCRRPTA
jgi:hypothetical protein